MMLLDLPTELIDIIIERLPTDGDRSAFIRTNSNAYNRFLSTLHRLATDKQAVLYWTCKNGHPSLASTMLHLGAKANFVPFFTGEGPIEAPLVAAISKSQLEVATVIMDYDPSTINQLEGEGLPLAAAIRRQNKNAVATLLARSELLDFSSFFQLAVIHLDPGNEEILDWFLSDPRFECEGFDLQHISCSKFSLEWIGKVLGVGKRHFANEGPTMLKLAVASNRQDVVGYLLAEIDKANPAILSGEAESAALSTAAKFAGEGITKLLLARKNVTSLSRAMALRSAVKRNATVVVKALLEIGQADVNAKNYAGNTPLSIAASHGSVEIVQLLLDTRRVDVNVENHDGLTPFAHAVKGGRFAFAWNIGRHWAIAGPNGPPWQPEAQEVRKVINRLLEERMATATPVQEVIKEGTSSDTKSVDWALEQRRTISNTTGGRKGPDALEVMKLLLALDDVNLDCPDDEGRTPLYWAVDRNQIDAVLLLFATKKVNPISKASDGRTPLRLSREPLSRGRRICMFPDPDESDWDTD